MFNEIAKIAGVEKMDKIVLMHDQEEAILSVSDIVFRCAFCLGVHAHPPTHAPHTRSLCCQGFMASELNGKVTETVETCFIHGEWTIAAGKLLKGGTFGKAAAKKYCDNVRLASCEPHYNYALDKLVKELMDSGDRARAEHVTAVLAAEDTPLCKSLEDFLSLTNNPAEQTFHSMKGHTKGKKGRRMTMTQFVTKLMNLTREQSLRPTVETKVSWLGCMLGLVCCAHPTIITYVTLQKLTAFQAKLVNRQKTAKAWDDARYKILRVCSMQLTYWCVLKIQDDLMKMDNHHYAGSDGANNFFVNHRNNEEWQFTVTKLHGKWICLAPEGRRCWRNVRLGRPCQHMLLAWCNLLRLHDKTFQLKSVARAFNKVYRQTHYLIVLEDSFEQLPAAPEPVPLCVPSEARVQIQNTKKLLEYVTASAPGDGIYLLNCLQFILNRFDLTAVVVHTEYWELGCAMHTN